MVYVYGHTVARIQNEVQPWSLWARSQKIK